MKKRTIQIFLLVVLGLSSLGNAYAQQDPQFTQYMFNGLLLNPAYAGSKGFSSFSGSFRSQWTGLEGAPLSQTVSFDANLNKKLGAGAVITHDRLGAQRYTEVTGNVAARISLNRTTRLAVGISLGAAQQVVDGTMLRPEERDDLALPFGIERAFTPTAKIGAYLHSNLFYAGASVSNLLFFKDDVLLAPTPHLFLTAGGVIDLGPELKFKPSFLLKEDFSGPAAIDLNAFVLFSERFWVGASYRTSLSILNSDTQSPNTRLSNTLAGILEVYASPRLRFGYSYDFSVGGLQNYSSHEISVGYYLLKNVNGRMLTPRYF
ncbi:type IX secretion system membrane protein PorP/SprF [Rufibacter sp. LB8]|uniref:PorP/SprF family type IX secretion system membrane protein n=1 Tax=Rufibacter sp. LB8 TaxID=2777781 RepID=UPI00178C1F32|nr:type IX secretion system membrane protein PorP/SprF [Rufibacter sp. LB8]